MDWFWSALGLPALTIILSLLVGGAAGAATARNRWNRDVANLGDSLCVALNNMFRSEVADRVVELTGNIRNTFDNAAAKTAVIRETIDSIRLLKDHLREAEQLLGQNIAYEKRLVPLATQIVESLAQMQAEAQQAAKQADNVGPGIPSSLSSQEIS